MSSARDEFYSNVQIARKKYAGDTLFVFYVVLQV